MHGDLYAHNILVDDGGHSLLGDFGAASFYAQTALQAESLEKIEVRAFGVLLAELLKCIEWQEPQGESRSSLQQLVKQCSQTEVLQRPGFATVLQVLADVL